MDATRGEAHPGTEKGHAMNEAYKHQREQELRQDDSFNLIEALDRIVNWSEVELLLRHEIMRRLQFAEDNGYREGGN